MAPPSAIPRRLRPRSLRTKFVLPLVALMLASALGSSLAFLGGTNRTRNQLLDQQSTEDLGRVEAALQTRLADIQTAAGLLASDPAVNGALASDSGSALAALNSRAVVVRDRFGLDLVQIYRQDQARTNLVLAPLFRQSSLIQSVPAGRPAARALGGHLLLLSRVDLPGQAGSVIVGIDLESELGRILANQRLPGELALALGETTIATNPALAAGAAPGAAPPSTELEYVRRQPLALGDATFRLTLARHTGDLARVTSAGLAVMIGSTIVTTLLLAGLGALVVQTMTRPLRTLAAAAEALAEGDLSVRAAIDTGDELEALGRAFNTAADRLAEALAAQRRETQRERAILASIGEGVLVTDAEGRIVVLNTAAYGIIGKAEAERLHQAAEQRESSHTFYAALEAIQPAFDVALGRLPESQQLQRVTLAGRTFRVNSSPIWLEQELLGAVASLQDITAEVESERMKSEFIAIAAHELRTPLTSIRGFVDLFKYTDMTNLSEQQRLFVDIIDRNSVRLKELINDLLDISKLDQNRAEVEPRPVRLDAMAGEALDLARPQADAASISLSGAFGGELPQLNLDPAHIRRILQNLISNAIKYTRAGGSVAIGLARREQDVLLSVRDTGVGIPLKDQPRIFGRFFRADNPLSAQVGGTGLGLAITKSLVELNRGTIYFESGEGEGTTFYVTFPLALACEPLREQEAGPAPAPLRELIHAA